MPPMLTRPRSDLAQLLSLHLVNRVPAISLAVFLDAVLEAIGNAFPDVDLRTVVEIIALLALQPHVFSFTGLCHRSHQSGGRNTRGSTPES